MAEKYLQPFLSEIRSYCEVVTEFARVLRASQITAGELGSAAAGLTRVFHTIAGLSSSLEIADFAGLAEHLETCLLSISADASSAASASISGSLADLLDFTTAYLAHRLQVMETSGQFQPPAPEDEEPLHMLEERLWQLGIKLEPPDEEAALPAESLSEDDLAILRAFHESDLAAAEEASAGASTRAASDTPQPAPKVTAPLAPPVIKVTAPLSPPATSARVEPVFADETIPPEMVDLFRLETKDDLYLLQGALARLETPEERLSAAQDMRRVAHKIKGAAATLNLQVVAGLAHCLEDILDLLKSQRLAYAPAVVDALMRGVIELEVCLGDLSPEAENVEGLQRLRAQYEALLAVSEPESASDPEATQLDGRRLAAVARQAGAQTETPASEQSAAQADPQREHAGVLPGRELSLRVEVNRLDRLMGLAGELASNRASTGLVRQEINEALNEVRRAVQKMYQLVNQLDEEAPLLSASWTSAPALAASPEARDGTPRARSLPGLPPGVVVPPTREDLALENFDSEHSHLLRALREGVNDIATVSDSLQQLLLKMNGLAEAQDALTGSIQRDITHLRLVPIGQIFPRLQLTARMIAQEQNKQINFLPSGATTEIDRDIIEAITGPLAQLVSNCVVHGIESAEERRKLGKPEVGAITLHAYYTGNEISIEIGDDGRGINPHRLINAAVAQGKLSPEEAARLDPEQALNLVLLPDISTSAEVTTVAGRGVGMDMVRASVESLKGTLHIHSTPGEGTTFHIRLPISLGILPALYVRAGEQTYAVPMSSIAHIWQPDDRQTPPNTTFFSLSEVLGLGVHLAAESVEAAGVAAPKAALIVPLRQRQIGVYVDEVLSDREVVVKPLPPHLRRRGVRGVILNPTGELLLLLDLPELAHRALSSAMAERFTTRDEPAPAAPITTGPNVLVVDDSLFMRRTLELQLTRAGYQVRSAKDGMEALHLITEERPHLVLLDIEMPQLDGYGLLSILRGQQQFSSLPVAILTSRAADIHRQHAMDLGANAYLVKPCPHDILLQTVAELANQP
jgi:chemosensory pili system protein ChpA (sensor histidine kinase/response regulator)